MAASQLKADLDQSLECLELQRHFIICPGSFELSRCLLPNSYEGIRNLIDLGKSYDFLDHTHGQISH